MRDDSIAVRRLTGVHMKRFVTFLAIAWLVASPHASAAPPEIEVEAAVLKYLLAHGPVAPADHTYGVDLPIAQLRQIEDCLGHNVRLYSIKAYTDRYHDSRRLAATCFWIKTEKIAGNEAEAEGGIYPVVVMTTWGRTPIYTTDFAYRLQRLPSGWHVTSCRVTGAS